MNSDWGTGYRRIESSKHLDFFFLTKEFYSFSIYDNKWLALKIQRSISARIRKPHNTLAPYRFSDFHTHYTCFFFVFFLFFFCWNVSIRHTLEAHSFIPQLYPSVYLFSTTQIVVPCNNFPTNCRYDAVQMFIVATFTSGQYKNIKKRETESKRIQRDRGRGGRREIYPQHIEDYSWSDADFLGSWSLINPSLRLRSSTLLLHLVSHVTSIVNLLYNHSQL